MDTLESLTGLGINKKAAKIYLAALALGTTTVMDLSKKAGLKRSTIYTYLEELLEQGLLRKIPHGKRILYAAAEPTEFVAEAEGRLQAMKKLVPQLLAMKDMNPGRPRVTIYEGRKGMGTIYDELCNSNSNFWRIWSNIGDFDELFYEVGKKMAATAREQQISVHEIVADTPRSKRSAQLYSHLSGRTHQIRVATAGEVFNDNIIFGNVVAFFRIHEHNLFVVRIEDQSVAESLKTVFDMAWKQAKPL